MTYHRLKVTVLYNDATALQFHMRGIGPSIERAVAERRKRLLAAKDRGGTARLRDFDGRLNEIDMAGVRNIFVVHDANMEG